MKFTINTKEFKNVMTLVKTVADSSASARISAHSVCLLRAFPGEKKLILEFSLNGSFLTYAFQDVQIEGDDEVTTEVKRSLDLGTLSALKFSGKEVSLMLGRNREGNTLEFTSGKLKGKLILSHPDVEKAVEDARPDDNSVELTQTFAVSDFLTALSAHVYGAHHNAVAASKRPVKIYSKQIEGTSGKILFASKDAVMGSLFSKAMTSPFKEDFSYYVLPKPFRAILDALSQDISPVFHFGIARDLWRVTHGNINVWFPNIIQETKAEFDDLAEKMETTPAFTLKTTSEALQEALTEIAPFTTGSTLVAKEDTPTVRLITENGRVKFALDTAKAKDVVVDLEDVEFDEQGVVGDSKDVLMINAKYLSECVSALAANDAKAKGKDPLYLLWWPHNNEAYPVRGKMFCLKQGGNYYWLARTVEKMKSL